MCLQRRAETLGANVLPFGLTTDVSAGALAAGAGGALGAGAAAPVQGGTLPGAQGDGFAQELKAVTGQTGAQVSQAAGQTPPAAAAGEALQVLKDTAGQPVVPGMQPQQPLPGGIQAEPKMSGAAGPAPVTPVDVPDPEITKGGEAGQPVEQAGDVTLASMAPSHMGVVLPLAPMSAEPAVSAVPQQTAATPAGPAIPAAGSPVAAGPNATGAVPPVPGPAPATAAGSLPVPPASAPANPDGAATLPQPAAGAGQAAVSPDAPAATPNKAAPVQQVAAPAGRRWQTELPQELRAPVTVPVQSRSGTAQSIQTQLPAVATAVSAGNKPSGVTAPPQAQAATPVQAGSPQPASPVANAPQAAAVQPLAQSEIVVTATPVTVRPAAGPAMASKPVTAGTQAQAQAGAADVAPVASAARVAAPVQAPAAAATGAVPLPVASEEIAVDGGEPAVDPLPGKPVPSEGAAAAGVKQAAGSGPAGAAQADTRPAAAQGAASGAANGNAATVAAAVPLAAAALLPGDEADLPLTPLEPGSTGEFSTASVRGGDLHGAVRTESLQAPSQSQSAHVATQVAAEIARNLKDGHTRFQMRFDPPELGRVEVNMRVGADGSVQAHLIVDRPETLDMFLRDQRGLERALEAAGLNPDSDNLQFSLKQDGGQQFASDQGDDNQQSGSGGNSGDGATGSDPDLTERVRLMLAEQRGGLDMKV